MIQNGPGEVLVDLELRLGSGSSWRYACAEADRCELPLNLDENAFIVCRKFSGEFLSILDPLNPCTREVVTGIEINLNPKPEQIAVASSSNIYSRRSLMLL